MWALRMGDEFLEFYTVTLFYSVNAKAYYVAANLEPENSMSFV